MTEIVTRTRELSIIESFYAPQVEGPIRLFDEQELVLAFPLPVGLAAGTVDGSGGVNITNDGLRFNKIQVPEIEEAGGWTAIQRANGYVAIAGGWVGNLYRNCDASFTRWQKVLQLDLLGEPAFDCSDIEFNPDTGRMLTIWGDIDGGNRREVWYSDDNGETWQQVDFPAEYYGATRSCKYNPITKTWFMTGRGPSNIHFVRSFDDGLTWEPVPNFNQTFSGLDIGINTINGAVVWLPDNHPFFTSSDNGETWVESAVTARPFNTAFSPDFGRFTADLGSFVSYSDDDGLTWTAATEPPGAGGFDISDITWLDNVPNKCFWAVTRFGFDFRSENGVDWEIINGPFGTSMFIASPLSPPAPPRAYQLTLPVERYEQIQEWRMDSTEDPVSVEQLNKDQRVRGKGLINADRGLEVLTGGTQDPPLITHTRDQLDDDYIAEPDHWNSRSRSVRVPGGYIQIHGEVGKASRWLKYDNELVGQTCEDLV